MRTLVGLVLAAVTLTLPLSAIRVAGRGLSTFAKAAVDSPERDLSAVARRAKVEVRRWQADHERGSERVTCRFTIRDIDAMPACGCPDAAGG